MVNLESVYEAKNRLKEVVIHTPLFHNMNLSDKYEANIYLKREDLQVVRSYKIRGAYNKITSLSASDLKNGVVCASAGNHAQGVAYSCNKLGIKGTIYMPATTPSQKVGQVKMFGKSHVEVVLFGDTFDDSNFAAQKYCKENGSFFIHPFNDEKVIEGQATVGLEILEDIKEPIDYLFVPVGGGGLSSGICSVFRHLSPNTKIIGVEPTGAPSMKAALEKGEVVTLDHIDKFVDGASVKRVGELNFAICKEVLSEMILVPEGKVCSEILRLYNEEAIVVEPAGALTISALDFCAEKIKGKNVVCIVSGSNNDITRTEEIKERSLQYEGLKHYFIIRFPQRAGALKQFLVEVLGPDDDITHFEYQKKNNREKGPALVGIELKNKNDFEGLTQRLNNVGFHFEYLNENQDLLRYLI